MLTITNTANLKYGTTETKLHGPSRTSPENHEQHIDKPLVDHLLHNHTPGLEGLVDVSVLPY
jgi:hypothetical protein